MTTPATPPPEINLLNAEYYINQWLSLLQFNLRVLEQAVDENLPLLERLRFLLIFSSNMDEFFEIRVAGLMRHIRTGQSRLGPDGMHPQDVLNEISAISREAVDKQYSILNDVLLPALEKENIRFLARDKWTDKQQAWIKKYFRDSVAPVITPIALDMAHPFPRLVNKSLNFIVSLDGKDAFGRQLSLAIIPAPKSLPRLIRLPEDMCESGINFVFLSSIIHDQAGNLFPGMSVTGCYQFRVTRNADLDLDDDIEDLTTAVKGELLSRRYGDEVRLEVADNCPKHMIDFLLRKFSLKESQLYLVNGPVNLGRLSPVLDINLPKLKFPPFSTKVPAPLQMPEDLFEVVAQQDILLMHPFESFGCVVNILRQAARDPNVLAIKQTLYRTGDKSEIIDALVEAARNGKEVTAVVELLARFDEASNIEGATRLQEAGAIVVYGVVGYKTHAKMILIVRREGNKIKRYIHLGTGNYHAGNARIYTDYSLITANEDMCEDVHKIFHQLTGMGRAAKLKHLFHSPFTLHSNILAAIEIERKNALEGKPAAITVKLNALTEQQIIVALYRASQAGVKVDLIVRGICCLRPGIPGVSENITVRSIIGRFLEHTRVYCFHNGGEQKIFCASADWMERNLFSRVETCFPILDPQLADRVYKEGLLTYLIDNQQAWVLQSDGTYKRTSVQHNASPKIAQMILLEKLAG